MSNAAVRLLLTVALCCASCSTGIAIAQANEADDMFAVAVDHYSSKHWELAVEGFRKFRENYPDHAKHARAMYFEAQSLVQLDHSAEAYSLFVDVLAEQPGASYARSALFGAAEAAVLSGQTNEAQVRLLQFQQQYPADKLNAKVLMYRGDLAMRANDISEAEQYYRDSIKRFADQPSADQCRLNLAHVLEVQNQVDAADQMLQEVARQDHSPWAEMALLQLGSKQLTASMPQAALELYEAIEKRFPNTPLLPQTHLGCGRALYQLGHFAEAGAVLAPLADDKQLGAAARYWIAMSQKADMQMKAAAEKQRREAEAAQAAEAAKSVKAPVAHTPAPATNSSIITVAPQRAAESTQSIVSSRRDPKAAPTTQHPVAEVTIGDQPSDQTSDQSPANEPSTEKAAQPAASSVASTPKSGLQQPLSAAGVVALDDQSRRRSAMIRYQQAEAMIRGHQYDKAIGMLEIGDNSGDDPSTLANRYLLAVALQGSNRDEEAIQALDELSAVLQAKLVAADASFTQSPHTALRVAVAPAEPEASPPPAALSEKAIADATPFPSSNNSLSEQDLTALKALNDQVQLARANSLLAREKYAEAIVPLQIYLATPRKDAGAENARSALAISLATVGRIPEAQQALADLKSNHPGCTLIPSTTERVAQSAYAAELFKIAGPLFKELAADGNPPELVSKGLAGAAWCLFQTGDYETADQAFGKFLDAFPNDPRAAEAALARCQAIEHESNDNAAATAYRQAIKRYPQCKQMPQLLLGAAKLYDRLQRPEDSAQLYQKLVADYPNSPDADSALYSWGWSLRDLGRGADADRVFQLLYD
ncbi:MAG TPA: tetratricopeptide repeat protein, partial [Pirellulales bacterium]